MQTASNPMLDQRINRASRALGGRAATRLLVRRSPLIVEAKRVDCAVVRADVDLTEAGPETPR